MLRVFRSDTPHPSVAGYRRGTARYLGKPSMVVPLPPCLTVRGRAWRWRKHVPRALRVRVQGRWEVTRGLGRIPLDQAIALADVLNQLVDETFHRAMEDLTLDLETLLRRITRRYAQALLEDARRDRAVRLAGGETLSELEEQYWCALSAEQDGLHEGYMPDAERDLGALLEDAGEQVDDERDRKVALYELQRARVRAAKRAYDECRRDLEGLPREDEGHASAQPAATPASILLSELVRRYVKDMYTTGRWREGKAARSREGILRRFIGAVGDRPADDLTRETVRIWRDEKAKQWKPGTLTTNLKKLGALFNWAEAEGLVARNPTKKLTLPTTEAARDARAPFTWDQLKDTMGQRWLDKVHTSRPFSHGPARYWVGLLLMATGARPEEICQLWLEDIEEAEGRLVIHIHEGEGRELKTPTSRRRVPVHTAVVEAGFGEYVTRLRAEGEPRLFPQWRRTRGSTLSSKWAQYFADYLRNACGFGPETRLVPYSLRHTVRQLLSEREVPEDVIRDILGHSAQGLTMGVYGGAASIQRMAEGLEAIPFEEVVVPWKEGPRPKPRR